MQENKNEVIHDKILVRQDDEPALNEKSFLRKSFDVFIKIFGVGLLLTLLFFFPYKDGESVGFNMLVEFAIRYELIILEEEATLIEQRMQEVTGTTTNEQYRPHLEIITNAIALFSEKHPDIKITFDRSRFSDVDLAATLLVIINDAWSFSRDSETSFLDELSYISSDSFNRNVSDDIVSFINHLKRGYAVRDEISFKDLSTINSEEESDEALRNELGLIKSDFESTVESNGLLTQEQVLVYFLERTDGNLLQAIIDMETFYKWLIRDGEAYDSVTWFYRHIQDQTNRNFSLNHLPENQDYLLKEDKYIVISIAGLNYHDWALIAFLWLDNATIAQLGTIMEYREWPHVAQGYKQRQDYHFLLQLQDISLTIDALTKDN